MTAISIVIGFTPLHAKNADLIIDDISGEVYCLFTKTWPKSIKYKRLGFNIPINGLFRSIKYIFSFIYFSFKVRSLINNNSFVRIYIPHPANIFTNNLFFNPKICEVNIYEDGLMNYYDVPANIKKVNFATRSFAQIFALPYKNYQGHLSGFDAREINIIYLTQPNLAVSRHKFRKLIKLTYVINSTPAIKGLILFLDQDCIPQITKEQREKIIYDMYLEFPATNWKYIYKSHHDYNRKPIEMTELPSSLKNTPAEDIISIINPELVISFFSTALINIKHINADTRCLALAASMVDININSQRQSLKSLFLSNNVECW